MNVLFAPDYRSGNPYQGFLARHLEGASCHVQFLSDYRRVLPLSRAIAPGDCDVIHLHWPEAYFSNGRGFGRWLRELRFPFDLRLATRAKRLVLTAHNLFPHRASARPLVRRNIGHAYQAADAIIAHSESARQRIMSTFKIAARKIEVIPHGDLSLGSPALSDKRDAREKLGLRPDTPLCLMFGRVDRYKGIDEVIEFWQAHHPEVQLLIAGACHDTSYAEQISRKSTHPDIVLRLERCSDAELATCLSAADATLFNYRDILTSGSACLARSLGIPVLLPRRLATIDLGEPSPAVIRFDGLDETFAGQLAQACKQPRQDDEAANWRNATAWENVAAHHASLYASL